MEDPYSLLLIELFHCFFIPCICNKLITCTTVQSDTDLSSQFPSVSITCAELILTGHWLEGEKLSYCTLNRNDCNNSLQVDMKGSFTLASQETERDGYRVWHYFSSFALYKCRIQRQDFSQCKDATSDDTEPTASVLWHRNEQHVLIQKYFRYIKKNLQLNFFFPFTNALFWLFEK